MDEMIINRIRNKVETLPAKSGVYLMKDDRGGIIYVGKAKRLKNRVKQYFDNSQKNLKTTIMASLVFDFDYIITNSELDAFNLENTLIKKYKPKYNILLKDDKSFPYIQINKKEKFPRVCVVRRPVSKHGLYGPYVTGISVGEIIACIRSAFKIRWCNTDFSNKKLLSRPCLHGETGDCVAPCVGNVSEEEYNKIIEDVEDFLNGKTSKVKKLLQEKMLKLADELKFEQAIEIKNQLKSLEKIDKQIITELKNSANFDVFGFVGLPEMSAFNVMMIRSGKNVGQANFASVMCYSSESEAMSSFISNYYLSAAEIPNEIVCLGISLEDAALLQNFINEKFNIDVKVIVPQKGIKVELCKNAIANATEYVTNSQDRLERHKKLTQDAEEELAKLVGTKKVYRIEGYDISNISGTNNVASMVVFEGGEPAKKEYRKFKIKTVDGPNDFACMKEALYRRLLKLKNKEPNFNKTPDIILIDGGLGQLHSAKLMLDELGLDIVMISLAKRDEEIYTTLNNDPIRLPKNNFALRLLQRVRDESHRFAVRYHRNLRSKEYKSELEKLNGIGKARLNLLYNSFKTIDALMDATISDFKQLDGVGDKLAVQIYNELHNNK